MWWWWRSDLAARRLRDERPIAAHVRDTSGDVPHSEYDIYVSRDRVAVCAATDRHFLLVDCSPTSIDVFDRDLRRLPLPNPVLDTNPDWLTFFDPSRWPEWLEAPDASWRVVIDEELALPTLFRHEPSGDQQELTNVLAGAAANESPLGQRLRHLDRDTVAAPVGKCCIALRGGCGVSV